MSMEPNMRMRNLVILGSLFQGVLAYAQPVPVQTWVRDLNSGWVCYPNEPIYDVATDMDVTPAGITFVTGMTASSDLCYGQYTTARYNSNGTLVWTQSFDPYDCGCGSLRVDAIVHFPSIAVDMPRNAVYVVGDSDGEILILKYAANNGTLQCVVRTSLARSLGNYGDDVVVDAQGNVFVSGALNDDTNFLSHFAVVKLDANCNVLWQRTFGDMDQIGLAHSIAVDTNGNIAAGGYVDGVNHTRDYTVVCFDPAGNKLWHSVTDRTFVDGFGGVYHLDDSVAELTYDSDGNVCSTGSSGNDDYYIPAAFYTRKFSPTGTLLWERVDAGSAGGLACAPEEHPGGGAGIVVDANKNVIVTGRKYNDISGDDFATLKFSSTGVLLWESYYSGPMGYTDGAVDVALDQAGNVYVVGASIGTESAYCPFDYVTVRYNGVTGAKVWSIRYTNPNGANSWDDIPCRIEVRGVKASIWVTGGSYDSVDFGEFKTIKYDQVSFTTSTFE